MDPEGYYKTKINNSEGNRPSNEKKQQLILSFGVYTPAKIWQKQQNIINIEIAHANNKKEKNIYVDHHLRKIYLKLACFLKNRKFTRKKWKD